MGQHQSEKRLKKDQKYIVNPHDDEMVLRFSVADPLVHSL